jgi:hypothetical protein
MSRRTFIDDLVRSEFEEFVRTGITPETSVADLAAAADEGSRECRQCGCTDARACLGGCYWVAADLCSTCARRL